MSAPENPCAFPSADGPFGDWHRGMTLRDWFAGQCAPMLIERVLDGDFPAAKTPEKVATFAYAIADAMLAAREQKA